MPDQGVEKRADAAGGTARRRLAERRKALGLTQEALADLMGVERSTVVRWERGETAPLPWIRLKLARALRVSADQLGELLAPAAPAAVDGTGGAGVPRQLPPAVAGFTGRGAELEALTNVLDSAGAGTPGAMVISAIGGTAGVGKTALAVQFAHQVSERFPDGQLYANLRGYDPGRPVPAAEALAGFLRALGVDSQDIAGVEDERAARYRSLMAEKRIMVVLDNAGSVDQVRPLLPGSPGCAVLVTSRDMLAGLVARDGATRLDLDVLPAADAVSLLTALIGSRADADPDATARLADLCCHLPLALRVAAELASVRRAAMLADLVGELADLRKRLDLLGAAGDKTTQVRAVFSWSYRHLDAAAAHAFRLLGLRPGREFDSYSTAALTGSRPDQIRRTLDTLTRAHLVQPVGADRYGMHDLLRAYARQLATSHDSPDEQLAALTRLFDHYLCTAATAMDTLFPAEGHSRPETLPPATPAPPLTDVGAARSWLDANRITLTEVAAQAAGNRPGHATRLATVLFRYLDAHGYYHDSVSVSTYALTAARLTRDRAAEASALMALGTAHWRLNLHGAAETHFGQALTLFCDLGDPRGRARALSGRGNIESARERYELAADYHGQALALFRETGDPLGQAGALHRLGGVLCEQGFHRRGARLLRTALGAYRELGDRHGEGGVLAALGIAEWQQGRYEQAAGYLQQALAVYRDISDRHGQAHALSNLGVVDWWQGRFQQAARFHHEAAGLHRETGDRAGEASALNAYGEALCAAGSSGDAATAHREALALAAQTPDLYQQARAHEGLGYTSQASRDLDGTRHHWEQAAAIYTSLGTPDAQDVRDRLGELSRDPGRVLATGPGRRRAGHRRSRRLWRARQRR